MNHTLFKRARTLAALTALVLALAGFAQADAATKKTKGKLNIAESTVVAGVTLSPGYYEVKEVRSPDGTRLRFTRVTENLNAQEGQPIYEWETVAEVKVVAEPLAASAPRTGFVRAASNDRAIALEIRGNNLDYRFEGE